MIPYVPAAISGEAVAGVGLAVLLLFGAVLWRRMFESVLSERDPREADGRETTHDDGAPRRRSRVGRDNGTSLSELRSPVGCILLLLSAIAFAAAAFFSVVEQYEGEGRGVSYGGEMAVSPLIVIGSVALFAAFGYAVAAGMIRAWRREQRRD